VNEKNCPICHTSIPEHAPGGLCPACVLRGADETTPEPVNGPTVEEIAAAFHKLEILRLIGHGGMGYVYQARQPELDRMVALKILSPSLRSDPAFEERFAREARVLGKLKHPNIVTLYEHGESGGYFYLMMEFIDGVNLRQAMSAGRFSPEQALAIVPAICDALQTAHAQGVWHRDIKPENILLDKDGRVKIADFGIARIIGDPEKNFTLTRTGGLLGSVAYMAPEQHEKPHDVDHRADIYSLGVVIYEMLTGELPLGRFPLPSQRADVGKRIDEIVLRTLEKERELRQQSAGEVKTEVETVATDFSRPLAADQNGLKPATTSETPRFSQMAIAGTATPPQESSGHGKLAFGFFVAGFLGIPVILGVLAGKEEAAIIFGLLCLLLALILGVMSWRDHLGRFVVIATAVLFGVVVPLVTISYKMSERSALRRELEARSIARQRLEQEEARNKLTPQNLIKQTDDTEGPADAMRTLLKAARERNARVYQNGFSKSFKASLKEHGEDLGNFGDFGNCTFISANQLDATNAEVVVEAIDGSKRRFTFPMIQEDGEWRLNGVAPRQ
jgi:serine/threonine protein kinase